MGQPTIYHKKSLIQQIWNGGLKLWHFETKVKAIQLSWVKRLTSAESPTWKILPILFYNCKNLY